MAGRLSPTAQTRYNTLAEFTARVQRVYGMVEVFAAERTGSDRHSMPLSRAFNQLKLQLMAEGLDAMSQLCGSLQIAAKRTLSHPSKVRILREGVGSLRYQLELTLRSIVSEDQAEQQRKQTGEVGPEA